MSGANGSGSRTRAGLDGSFDMVCCQCVEPVADWRPLAREPARNPKAFGFENERNSTGENIHSENRARKVGIRPDTGSQPEPVSETPHAVPMWNRLPHPPAPTLLRRTRLVECRLRSGRDTRLYRPGWFRANFARSHGVNPNRFAILSNLSEQIPAATSNWL